MLIEFRFKNYRSFRDEAVLSMEATGQSSHRNSLIRFKNTKLIPGAVIFGKNGGGKSNVIRAFWLATQFIRNAQRTQHEQASIPVRPFLLDDYSDSRPTEFSFIYSLEGVKYWYSFSATSDHIVTEQLYHAPRGQKALVFSRDGQFYTFHSEKARRQLVSEAVAENQLYFSVACTMNDQACINAMKWFREQLFFSRDFTDVPNQLIRYQSDSNMLKAIRNYAVNADLGIEDMEFEFDSQEIDEEGMMPKSIPDGLKTALMEFAHALSELTRDGEVKLKMGKVKATALHKGIAKNGSENRYPLGLADESDGTRRLMSLAPAVEAALNCGGVLLVDEIEKELHPALVELLVSKFQSSRTNQEFAQIVFTTHSTELMNMELLRKDQLYFVDKDRETGASELYSIGEFTTKTTENVRKSYLLGKYGAVPDVEIEEVE